MSSLLTVVVAAAIVNSLLISRAFTFNLMLQISSENYSLHMTHAHKHTQQNLESWGMLGIILVQALFLYHCFCGAKATNCA